MNQAMDELLLKLHEQFAENQNDTSNRFVKVFLGVLVLFGFYGFAFALQQKMIVCEGIKLVNDLALILLSILVLVVLTFLIAILLYQAYQHRRDQAINNKIRYKYLKNEAAFEYFFSQYKGTLKHYLSYIPDYILVQISFFYVLSLATIILQCRYVTQGCEFLFIQLFLFLMPLGVNYLFYLKYKKLDLLDYEKKDFFGQEKVPDINSSAYNETNTKVDLLFKSERGSKNTKTELHLKQS
jgi:hypothetical protein